MGNNRSEMSVLSNYNYDYTHFNRRGLVTQFNCHWLSWLNDNIYFLDTYDLMLSIAAFHAMLCS